MNINPFFGNHSKFIEVAVDTSSNEMQVHLRNMKNDIINNNDNKRDIIKLFPITVGDVTHTIRNFTYYHMMCNNIEENIVLSNKL